MSAPVADGLIDVFIVTFWSQTAQIARLLTALAGQTEAPCLRVYVYDNSTSAIARERLQPVLDQHASDFASIALHYGDKNLGFGLANNALLARSQSDWVLLLNPDSAPDPGSLGKLLAAREHLSPAAAFEMRQRPYEHPKYYNVLTRDTEWVSGAAVLFARSALAEVNGFDPKLFLYGEDVDLSYRLRAAGHALRYVFEATALHESYAYAEQIKPAQTLGSTFANLCLRRRYGSNRDVWTGVKLLIAEVLEPPSFPGRNLALLKNLFRFLKHYRYFSRTRVAPTAAFEPRFAAWDFEVRRKGAFHPVVYPLPAAAPLVSILIRTHRRAEWLCEAVRSALAQDYPAIEVVIVEDGADTARGLIEALFGARENVRYHATGAPVGRAQAGNIAMSLAQGTWFNFLDDDDLLFPDHVSTLYVAAVETGLPGVYGIGMEMPTEKISDVPLRYHEGTPFHRYQIPFNHLTLWVHNYIPIQCVLFQRALYARHGGFATDMDQLEDWNLWTRYTLEAPFALVDKTTSLYRVPLSPAISNQRQTQLDEAYRDAVERQRAMEVRLSPRLLAESLARTTLVPGRLPSWRRRLLQQFTATRIFLRWRDWRRG